MRTWQFTLGDLFRVQTLLAALFAIGVLAVNSGGCGPTYKRVDHLEFSPDGRQLLVKSASVRYDCFHTKVWQRETTKEIFLLHLDDQSRNLIESHKEKGMWLSSPIGFTANGNDVAIQPSGGGPVRYWDVHARDWKDRGNVCELDGEDFWFSSTGKRVAVMDRKKVQIKDAATGGLICTWSRRQSPFRGFRAVFAQEDDIIALGYYGYVELRSAVTGNLLKSWQAKPDHALRLCDLSYDGSKLVLNGSDGLYLHQVKTDQVMKVLHEYYQVVRTPTSYSSSEVGGDATFDAKFSPDGQQMVAVGEYGAMLFDASNGKPIGLPLTDEWTVNALFSPDGKSLITSDDGDLVIWDSETRKRIRRIRIPGNFQMPWTVPLFLFGLWVVACWRLLPRRRIC